MNKNMETLYKEADAKKTALIAQLQKKLAEAEEDAKNLAEGLVEEQGKNENLAEQVGDKTEKTVEVATAPATEGTIEEDTKNLLVEAMTNIDPEIGSALADEIEMAENKGEEGGESMGQKVAAAVASALTSYVKKAKLTTSFGTMKRTAGASKLTSSTNKFQQQAEARLDALLSGK